MGDSNTTTQTQTSSPFAPAIPLLEDAASNAQALFGRGGLSPAVFQGSLVPNFSPQTQSALTQLEARANAPSVGQGASLFAQNLLANQGLTPEQQEVIEELRTTATGPGLVGDADFQALIDEQARRTAENVNSIFSGAGRLGSGANQGVVAREVGQQRLNALINQANQDEATRLAASNALLSGAGSGTAAALQAAGLGGALDQASLFGPQLLAQVGGTLENQQRQQLLDQARLETGNADIPLNNLLNFVNLGSTIGGQGGTTTATSTQPGPGTAQLLAGGLLGGASLLSGGGLLGAGGLGGQLGFGGQGLLGLFN